LPIDQGARLDSSPAPSAEYASEAGTSGRPPEQAELLHRAQQLSLKLDDLTREVVRLGKQPLEGYPLASRPLAADADLTEIRLSDTQLRVLARMLESDERDGQALENVLQTSRSVVREAQERIAPARAAVPLSSMPVRHSLPTSAHPCTISILTFPVCEG
jgi:hypothetical protein